MKPKILNLLSIKCPKCGKLFRPYGAFTLEACFCPYCGYKFYVLRGANLIRGLYILLTFSALMTIYATVRPQTSVVIVLFWLSAIIMLKFGTYALHIILFVTWTLFSMLKHFIFHRWEK